MTCYLTDEADPRRARARPSREGVWVAAKLYPADATTNSAHGVTDIRNIYPALERMQEIGMPLLVHGEVTDPDVDVFDREAVFIERVLDPLVRDFPALKIVFEHITTAEAADFVRDAGPNVAATITPQHLHLNRNALFAGGLRPHAYCLPVAKREKHRLAVRAAATSGSPKFFLGTDSAPHPRDAKESACGCAGIFNAPFALESYAQVFEEEGALDRFEGFASEHGARFYGLPLNEGTVTLERRDMRSSGACCRRRRRAVPRRRDAGLALRRLGRHWRRTAAGADDPAEMALRPPLAFARAPLQPGAVDDDDPPAAGGDQPFVLQRRRPH